MDGPVDLESAAKSTNRTRLHPAYGHQCIKSQTKSNGTGTIRDVMRAPLISTTISDTIINEITEIEASIIAVSLVLCRYESSRKSSRSIVVNNYHYFRAFMAFETKLYPSRFAVKI